MESMAAKLGPGVKFPRYYIAAKAKAKGGMCFSPSLLHMEGDPLAASSLDLGEPTRICSEPTLGKEPQSVWLHGERCYGWVVA